MLTVFKPCYRHTGVVALMPCCWFWCSCGLFCRVVAFECLLWCSVRSWSLYCWS